MKTSLSKFKIQFAILVSLAWSVSAQQMNYQGRLTDATGAALADGQYTISFELYTAPTGGTRAWGPFIADGGNGDGHGPKADLVNGRFNVILGPRDTNSVDLAGAFAGARYLQMTVGSAQPLLPRQQVLSAPLAMYSMNAGRAAVADSLSGAAVNFTDLNVSGNLNLGGALNGVAVANGNLSIPGTLTVNGNETLLGTLNLPGSNNGLGSISGGSALSLLGGGASEAARRIETRGAVVMSPPNGTAAPGDFQTLTVTGKIAANTLVAQNLSNGSSTWNLDQLLAKSPPLIVDTVPNLNNTINHQVIGTTAQGINIKDYIADADGCTMRITLVHKISHEVRFMEAHLTVAPKDLTLDPLKATQTVGRTLQQPGSGELNWIMHDNVRHFMVDAWSGPWVRVLDFWPGLMVGAQDGNPPTDTSKMEIWFHLHPHVAGRIVILD